MSPDRKILGFTIPERRSEMPQEEGFTASVQGADQVYKWLSLKHLVASNEMLNNPALGNGDLDLGTDRINGSIITEMSYFVKFDSEDLEYHLVTGIETEEDPSVPKSPSMPGMGELLGNLAQARSNFERQMSVYEQKLKHYNAKLFKDLQVALGSDNDDLEIVIPDSEDELTIKFTAQDQTREFSFHPSPQHANRFFMHTQVGTSGMSESEFTTLYQRYGEISARIANALYKIRGETPPQRILEIKPPKNLEDKLNVAEGAINQRKRMLQQSGFMDGDEELAETIRDKVQLIEKPTETFADIGGNERAKEELQTIVHALKDPEAYRRWGTKAPRGVLLFGEPGTGKTMLTKALANEAGVRIYVVELADVLHSLWGRTERLLNEVFKQARENAPAIVLVDELDALAGIRDRSSEINSRIVTVLNTNLDGLKERPEGIVVVGTTNRVDAIDPALKRPGRLDMLVPVDMPDEAERAHIARLKIAKAVQIATAAGGGEIFDPSLDVNTIANSTNDFSGADIEEVIRRSLARKVRQEEKGLSPTPVSTEDILDVIAGYETVRKVRRLGFRSPGDN